jgi:hypothetical protein
MDGNRSSAFSAPITHAPSKHLQFSDSVQLFSDNTYGDSLEGKSCEPVMNSNKLIKKKKKIRKKRTTSKKTIKD